MPLTVADITAIETAAAPVTLSHPRAMAIRQAILARIATLDAHLPTAAVPLDQTLIDDARSLLVLTMMLPAERHPPGLTAAITALIPDIDTLVDLVISFITDPMQGVPTPASWYQSTPAGTWLPAPFVDWLTDCKHPLFPPGRQYRWLLDPTYPQIIRQILLPTPNRPPSPPFSIDLRPPVTASTLNSLRLRLGPWALPFIDPPIPIQELFRIAEKDLLLAVAALCCRGPTIGAGWLEVAAAINAAPVIGLSEVVLTSVTRPTGPAPLLLTARWRCTDLDRNFGLDYIMHTPAPNPTPTSPRPDQGDPSFYIDHKGGLTPEEAAKLEAIRAGKPLPDEPRDAVGNTDTDNQIADFFDPPDTNDGPSRADRRTNRRAGAGGFTDGPDDDDGDTDAGDTDEVDTDEDDEGTEDPKRS